MKIKPTKKAGFSIQSGPNPMSFEFKGFRGYLRSKRFSEYEVPGVNIFLLLTLLWAILAVENIITIAFYFSLPRNTVPSTLQLLPVKPVEP